MKKFMVLIALVIMSGLIFAHTVRNQVEFEAAISASSSGDVIQIANSFVVTGNGNDTAVTIGKSLTINGNGFEISVPRPGLDDMGRYNTSPSTFRTFSIETPGTAVTINDLQIKGGFYDGSGGAIKVGTSTKLVLNNCIVSSSRASSGGGIYVEAGLLYLNGSYLRRNAASYGGGLLLLGDSRTRAYVENSSMIENRSTSANGGGGAVECQVGAVIYFNNSTLANNQSTEIGGAINNYRGTVYFVNSSATGNVAFGGFTGGAIGNNGGDVFIVNSLLAHNYRRTTGTVANPTGYVLDDVVAHGRQDLVREYYSAYHATIPSGLGANVSNVQYNGLINGSDNTIFSGGILSKITDNDGTEIGDPIFRPFLYDNQGGVAPTLKPGSFITLAGNRGTPTRFANNNNVNPAIAYKNGSSYVDLLGTSQAGQQVVTDQVNQARSATVPSRGAIENETAATLYIVKVNGASGGTVTGGTIYGDVYASGTVISLTAIPYTGYTFVRWDYVAGGSGTASTSNPYSFTVTGSITLIPVFQASGGGSYSITYIGNDNTGGTPPASGTYYAPTAIAGSGTLVRSEYNFVNWNTNSNGSGTSYTAGVRYSGGANITLYAQWQRVFDFPQTNNTLYDQIYIHPSEDLNQDDAITVLHPIITSLPSLGTIQVLGLLGIGNSVSIDVTAPAGNWYGSVYYRGAWHQSSPTFIATGDASRIFTFTGVNFAAKAGEVIILLSGNENSTLPVELSSFTAVATPQNYVRLDWVTQSETGVSGYYIYRNNTSSLSAAEMVSNLISASNTSQEESYSFTDKDATLGTWYYWLQCIDMDGQQEFFGPRMVSVQTDTPDTPIIPLQTSMGKPYPNPFNPSITIAYGLAKAEHVQILIYNSKGQKLRTLVDATVNPGSTRLIWNGTDDHGKALSSGMYFIKMTAGKYNATEKIFLMK